MNIYYLKAESIYGVGNAFAITIADSEAEAIAETKMKAYFSNLQDPILLGIADPSFTKSKVIDFNNGDY